MAKVDYGHKVIEENERWIQYQFNNPIYDDKGYFTRFYDDSNPDIVTVIKPPPIWYQK